MLAGHLDRRIEIQRATTTTNAFNEPVPTWGTVATVWARKRDVSDKERQQAGETAAEITTRFQVRFSATLAALNPKDRLVCEARIYDIWGVKEIGRREGLEISATARADLIAPAPPVVIPTADSTLVSADSTLITADAA
jgi:SPP1 family predicted phage head-tail adaptor